MIPFQTPDVPIFIVCPSGPVDGETLAYGIANLRENGFSVVPPLITPADKISCFSAPASQRLNEILGALSDPNPAVIWAARGGYGACDLLARIPWDSPSIRSKLVIGFSDISAILSALYCKGHPSIHGLMPGSPFWTQASEKDRSLYFELIRNPRKQQFLPVKSLRPEYPNVEGKIFGGCLSVLTNLIGTPYLPKSLAGHILFFEDVGENLGQVLRYLRQWQLAGYLDRIRGIIWGTFTRFRDGTPDNPVDEMRRWHEEFFNETPGFFCSSIGHSLPNLPIGIGALGQIQRSTLTWQFSV